jgi:hypothetical protein
MGIPSFKDKLFHLIDHRAVARVFQIQYSGTNKRWSIIYGLIFQNAKKSCLSLQFTVKSFLNFAIMGAETATKIRKRI